MAKQRNTLHAGIGVLAFSLIAFLVGCGNHLAPLAPGQAPSRLTAAGVTHLTLSVQAAPRAAKKAKLVAVDEITGLCSLSASGVFFPDSDGRLDLSFPRYATDENLQVKSVSLQVPHGAIPSPTTIVMTVFSGFTLSDIALDFSPTGLRFLPEATLKIVVWGDLDPATVNVYHIEGAVITEMTANFVEGKKTWTIVVKIPGFSQYSMGDDYAPETVGAPGSPTPPDPPTP